MSTQFYSELSENIGIVAKSFIYLILQEDANNINSKKKNSLEKSKIRNLFFYELKRS